LVIAQETIDRIRDLANIADVIGESVKLERKGRSLTGLCPFHKEKSPSFNVNEERGFYHCFGCKASGDVFKFVQETEGLSFLEAVRRLAEKLGIEVEDNLSSEEKRRRNFEKRKEQALYDVNASAAHFFEEMLQRHELAHFAHKELAARRLPYDGPAGQALRDFRIGYAPDSWDELTQFLGRAGLDLRAAEAVGLIVPRQKGQGYYDRFRHRLMFAVIDLHGRVIAFSGRSLPPTAANTEDTPAKYINSPESPIYRKRSTVFGLYQARQSLRDRNNCIVVEGNFDVVSLHAHGIREVVAPLGTAFTSEQGKLIRRFSNQITFLFDGDSAGRKATAQSRLPAKESGLSAKVARLPDGSDPDEFIRTKGSEQLRNLLDRAPGMLSYLISEVLDERFSSIDQEAQARRIQKVIDLINEEEDESVRALLDQHALRLGQALKIGQGSESTFHAIRRSLARSVGANQAARQHERGRSHLASEGTSDSIGRAIVGALLDFPELLDDEKLLQNSIHLEGDPAAALATLRLAMIQNGGILTGTTLHGVLLRLPDRLRSFGAERLAQPKHLDIDTARVELFANLDKLRHMELTRLSSSALSQIERARLEGDYDQELALLKEQEERARKKRGL
jgi:DNA primase